MRMMSRFAVAVTIAITLSLVAPEAIAGSSVLSGASRPVAQSGESSGPGGGTTEESAEDTSTGSAGSTASAGSTGSQTPSSDPSPTDPGDTPTPDGTSSDPTGEPSTESPTTETPTTESPTTEAPAGESPAEPAAPQRAVTAPQSAAAASGVRAISTRAFWNRLRFAPSRYVPRGGPTFNNPYGGRAASRRNLTHVIRTINAMPGYRLRLPNGRPRRDPDTGRPLVCPRNPLLYPSTIRIALYSIADKGFTDALARANRRCISVKVLMNSHLNTSNSPAWRRVVRSLGNRGPAATAARQRSFGYRCSHGCLGTNILHSKIYLFDRVVGPGSRRAQNVVITGSSNMTFNAVRVQWNDLFTVPNNRVMYSQYLGIFNAMTLDRTRQGPRIFRAGPYISTFYPFFGANARTDRIMVALRSIRCNGARGAGIGGHSVVHIVMHSWHGSRGKYLAQQVRRMYAAGCYVRILYSFMGHGTFRLLTRGTGPRMVARRVLFPGPNGVVAAKYSHMKMLAVSGRVGNDRSAWVVWTGSNNWADRSVRADEVTLRIPSRGAYVRYVNHWQFMRNRRSSSVWAIYEEPNGGGRAPLTREI
jgi:PLD-like domain